MIVKRAIKNSHVVAGGGATEVRPRATLSPLPVLDD
jgi:chaperonin GroEL (HSP60 family)